MPPLSKELKEFFKKNGAKGGSADTEKQQLTRSQNLKNWHIKQGHKVSKKPFEPRI
jgi:hypothetical protein